MEKWQSQMNRSNSTPKGRVFEPKLANDLTLTNTDKQTFLTSLILCSCTNGSVQWEHIANE